MFGELELNTEMNKMTEDINTLSNDADTKTHGIIENVKKKLIK